MHHNAMKITGTVCIVKCNLILALDVIRAATAKPSMLPTLRPHHGFGSDKSWHAP